MLAMEIIVLVASVVAATLGVVAIVLALVHYRMTSRLACNARQGQQSLIEVAARVERLYDTLYRDAMTLLKDSCADARRAAAQSERLTEQRLARLKQDIAEALSGELARLLREQASEEQAKAAMAEIVDRVIAQSRPAD